MLERLDRLDVQLEELLELLEVEDVLDTMLEVLLWLLVPKGRQIFARSDVCLNISAAVPTDTLYEVVEYWYWEIVVLTL